MKKIIVLFSLTAAAVTGAFAQAAKVDSLTYKRAQSVYFELLGNGASYSLNYDTRFQNKQTGPGVRVGLSYIADTGDHLFTLPVAANFLAGKGGKYFEFGAGITYFSANYSSFNFFDESTIDSDSGVFGTLIFGYRKQPLDSGYTFRAGVSPIITSNSFIPYWPYISFGYKF